MNGALMRRVWGFAFFWFAVGMIADFFLSGLVNFIVLIVTLVAAYILFCK